MDASAHGATRQTVVTTERSVFIMPPGHECLRVDGGKRLLFAEDECVLLTPLEYQVMQVLVCRYGQPVAFDDLTEAAFTSAATLENRTSLRRHIERVRVKLRACHLAICYVTDFGYVLLHIKE